MSNQSDPNIHEKSKNVAITSKISEYGYKNAINNVNIMNIIIAILSIDAPVIIRMISG